jgi:ATP-binding cassette, subfamily G (WHITE), member 2, SNQ2
MYRISPYTYSIEGLLGTAIGRSEITCAEIEYVTVTPPSGMTCAAYLQRYIDAAGGYILDGNATGQCEVCPYRTTDQFLGTTFNIEYGHRWRNVGIFIGFIGFNVSFPDLIALLVPWL